MITLISVSGIARKLGFTVDSVPCSLLASDCSVNHKGAVNGFFEGSVSVSGGFQRTMILHATDE